MDNTFMYDNKNGDVTSGGISGFNLKLIAMVTMFIDHIGAGIIERLSYPGMAQLDYVLRSIGRMAFPLYIFLLIEGFGHTRNRYKYALNMFIFAIISEIPFDLVIKGTVLEFKHNNVFITLFLGLVTIMLLDGIRNLKRFLDASKSAVAYVVVNCIRFIGMAAIILAMMAVAKWEVRCDYGAGGIAAIVAMYLLRSHPKIGYTAGVILLALFTGSIEIYALLMLIPINYYNGTRGTSVNKYVFYAFYPLHLLVIWAAMVVCGL